MVNYLPLVIPQPEVVTSAATGANQLVVHARLSRPTRHFAGFMMRLSITITGTAPGTARGVSQIIHDVQVTNEKNVLVASMDGQALFLASADSIGVGAAQELLPQDQWVTDNVTGATGVASVGIWTFFCDFPGTILTITVNLNAATATGYTAISAASAILSCAAIESHSEFRPHLLKGEYITNTAKYIGTYPCKYVSFGADNSELGAIVTGIKVGGSDFTALQCQIAEELFNASVPTGLPSGMTAAPLAGLSTVSPKNPQTGNGIGAARLFGQVASPAYLTFNTSPVLFVVSRIPISA